MRIVIVGGGPGGLYFAILAKRADPGREVIVLERNRPGDTFGFGVVLSDATLDHFREADGDSHAAIAGALAHWEDIHIHYRGEVLTSTGHGFAGLSRRRLLEILHDRAAALGVVTRFATEVRAADAWAGADLVVGADGVNSWVRARHARRFQPVLDWRRNRFVWLGTTYPFPAFTFLFKEDEHGLWRVHAYRYDGGHSTFILETTEDTWRRAGLDEASEADTAIFAQALFAPELEGHPVLTNRSLWRGFPTVRNARWHDGRVVLLGDAAHTAHFSIGSGTRLAMEDAIALAGALGAPGAVEPALAAYEAERRPQVEALQRAAQTSLEWFEHAERYHGQLPPLQFAFSLLTRSLRVTHETLRARDPRLVAAVDAWFAEHAAAQSGVPPPAAPAPPVRAPFRLRGLVLPNRLVVAPAALEAGAPDEGAVAQAVACGAGLVLAGRIEVGAAPEPAAWSRLVGAARAAGGTRIGLELRFGSRRGPVPDAADLDGPRDDLARAARLAAEAGFDLLALHWPPAGLLSEGRPLARGLRAPLDLLGAVRAAWPADRPLAVRIAGAGDTGGALAPADWVEVARALRLRGCDVLDVSAGHGEEGAPARWRHRQTAFSDRLRQEAGIPTMTAAASYAEANSILAAGRADLCVLAGERPPDPAAARRRALQGRVAGPPLGPPPRGGR